MDELLSEFVAETQELLDALTNVVLALEADPSDRHLLDELFRFFHTVKGSCGFLNLPRFEKLSHAAEDVLAEIRAGDSIPDAATISAVFAVMDRIAELCTVIEAGDALPQENDDQLIEQLRHCHQMANSSPADGQGMPDGMISGAEARRATYVSRTIRLPLSLIDQLMNGVSDMVLARNELARKLRDSGAEPELETAFDRLSGCVADMRDMISKSRMQRVDRLFMPIPRIVRDLSRELGKTIELTLEGGDVEMDREMVEMVIDPLIHIVRNSIDHGIEAPADRLKAGKTEAGHVRISARQSGSQIVIEVVDDGRGIDVDSVVSKVVNSGIMSTQEIVHLSDQAKLDLIFMPGLSTAAEITSVSGRGVGMDVVRANIERIGGLISLTSTAGQGLAVTMRVPLTLTIIPGLILSAGGISFAIPRSAVVEILHDNNPAVALAHLGGGLTATIRNVRHSMIDLEDVIGLPKEKRAGPRSLMIVRSAAGKPYILGVGHVENHEELVIRPAAPIVMATGIYAGMTLPDNGQPMLLLDAGGIAQVAKLPLIVETIESLAGPAAEGPRNQDTYTGLRFIELTGEERVLRLSLVERVENIPIECFGSLGARAHVTVGGRLVSCASHVNLANLPKDCREVTCLRVRDDTRELCYPIGSIVDISEIPETLDMVAPHETVAGLVLIDGNRIEVVDSLALLADTEEREDLLSLRSRCVIADRNDSWNVEILAPLLVRSGYEVVWATDGQRKPDDIMLLTSDKSDVDGTDGPVVRLRRSRQPSGPDDTSICRYDQEVLLKTLAALGEQQRNAA